MQQQQQQAPFKGSLSSRVSGYPSAYNPREYGQKNCRETIIQINKRHDVDIRHRSPALLRILRIERFSSDGAQNND